MSINLDLLRIYLDEHSTRREQYVNYWDYYDGEHQQVKLNDRTIEFLQANGFTNFRANVCAVVVDSMAYRLKVSNFASPDDFDDWAWQMWVWSNLPADQHVLFQSSLVRGDAYAVGEWYTDPLTGLSYPRFRPNSAYNCYAVYDDSDSSKMLCFLKRWQLRGEAPGLPGPHRLNVYFDDHIEKYLGRLEESSADINWTLLGVEDWPAGVIPAVHLPNRGSEGSFGTSEIKDAVPLQDALNKSLVDLMVVLDQQGWPQRWAKGSQAPAGGWSNAPGIVWHADSAEAEFGQLAAANPLGLVQSLESIFGMVASTTRTPQHAFHTPGDRFPSGEALKTAEAGLIEKCEVYGASAGASFERMVRIGAKMQETFGAWPPKRSKSDVKAARERFRMAQEMGSLTPEPVTTAYSFTIASDLQCQWRDFETRNQLMKVQTINLKGDVISKKQRLREYGYNDDEVMRIESERQTEASEAPLQPQAEKPKGGVAGVSPNAAVQPGLASVKGTSEQNQPTHQQR